MYCFRCVRLCTKRNAKIRTGATYKRIPKKATASAGNDPGGNKIFITFYQSRPRRAYKEESHVPQKQMAQQHQPCWGPTQPRNLRRGNSKGPVAFFSLHEFPEVIQITPNKKANPSRAWKRKTAQWHFFCWRSWEFAHLLFAGCTREVTQLDMKKTNERKKLIGWRVRGTRSVLCLV